MKTIVFDMDGVLFDTEKINARAWYEIANEWNLEHMQDTIERTMGRNRTDTIFLLKEIYGKDFDGEKFLNVGWNKILTIIKEEGLPIIDGVRETLSLLKEKNYKIGIASSSHLQTIKDNIAKTGLDQYFDEIVSGEMIEHSKPQPDIYIKACEKMGEKPKNVIAVEDSPNGLKAARAAGMKVVMIPNMIPAKGLEQYYDYVYENILDFAKDIENID